VGLQRVVSKRLCARGVHKFAIPRILALHAVWVVGDFREVPLNALAATRKLAIVAVHLDPNFRTKFFTTYWALCHLCLLLTVGLDFIFRLILQKQP
jgi:hypothetical protein